MVLPRFTNHWVRKFLYCTFIVSLTAWSGASGAVCAQVDDQENNTRAKREAVAAEQSPKLSKEISRDLQQYEKSIRPLLTKACFDCHSEDDAKGNFQADQLDPDFGDGKDITWWMEVYSVISKEEMPPADANELTDSDRALIVEWLSAEIQAAEKIRRESRRRSSFRRLTRYEYNYAMQDLLGEPWTFSGDLPDESSEEGAFENNAHSLRMSVKQVESYQQLAVNALQRITVRGDQPATLHWSISMRTAYEKRRIFENKKIQSAKDKFKDKPDSLNKELKSLQKEFNASADRSHYLDYSTGDRASVYWHHRRATNTTRHSDSYTPMPEPGRHFAVVQPGSRQDLTVELDDRLPNEGVMRVRVRASRAEGAGKRVPTLQLSFGFKSTDQGSFLKRVSQQDVRVEASFGQPEVYEWKIPLGEIEHRNPYRGKSRPGGSPNSSEYIRFTNSTLASDVDSADHENAAVLIEHIEVSAPYYEQWPPNSHRRVFIVSENSGDETVYARQIVSAFMTRAWRRTPTANEVDSKLQMFNRLRPVCDDFPQAIVEVLATVLTSPKFLYVLPGEAKVAESTPAPVTELVKSFGHAQKQQPKVLTTSATSRHPAGLLATRLSLFLWCSLPDDTLLELASTGQLNAPEVLQQQVERMLTDPRSERLHQHFVQQWLKLQPLEFLSPTRGDDGLDAALLESMKQQPIALFADMLQHDSSVLEFINADYSVINERLARHYGIADVRGNHFRRVAFAAQRSAQRKRGGLLTQAGMLAMNSDGEDSHPVKRGVWLLTNLLNDPPPPPPPAVPEIDLTDPEILKLTLKQRIERHRDHAACLSCHQKIDPWGIAFENYDALGRWRDEIDDRPIDANSVLPGKVNLDGAAGLKQHLLQNRSDQFVRATVEKMASFALGRQLDFADRASVTEITQQVRESGDGIKTVVRSLVTSELFRAN